MSRLAIILFFMFMFLILSIKFAEFFKCELLILPRKGVRILATALAILCVALPIPDIIGLIGVPGLWNRIPKSLAKNLINFNIEICNQTSTTIKDITRNTPNKPPESNACVYSIPCSGCNGVYIGQTSRTLKQRLDEHRRALKSADPKNALVIHRNAQNHNFNFKKAHPIKYIKASLKRKLIESALISQFKTIKQKTGSYQIAKPLLKSILQENKIPLDEKG